MLARRNSEADYGREQPHERFPRGCPQHPHVQLTCQQCIARNCESEAVPLAASEPRLSRRR